MIDILIDLLRSLFICGPEILLVEYSRFVERMLLILVIDFNIISGYWRLHFT